MTHEEQVAFAQRERIEVLEATARLIRHLAENQPHDWIGDIIRLARSAERPVKGDAPR